MKTSFPGRAVLGLCGLFAVTGCHRRAAVAPPVVSQISTPKTSAPAAPLTPEQLALKPNEAGVVPILEYHSIDPKAPMDNRSVRWSMFRHPNAFRKDLQRLYDEGYRPVNLSEYLNNKIDLPLGRMPVVLTFDDARQSQFNYLADGSVDPECAVGILQEFARAHPDWPMKATFFVLPGPAFGQPEAGAKKMQALLAMGCELGNHTVSHPILKHLSDEKVQYEIATGQEMILKMAPQARIDVLALPYGSSPRNRPLAAEGQYNGVHYKNRAVLLVGAEPARAVIARKFNPLRIPRVQACEGPSGITDWLNLLKSSKKQYVSDGDPSVTTIPKGLEPKIDPARLNGSALRLY